VEGTRRRAFAISLRTSALMVVDAHPKKEYDALLCYTRLDVTKLSTLYILILHHYLSHNVHLLDFSQAKVILANDTALKLHTLCGRSSFAPNIFVSSASIARRQPSVSVGADTWYQIHSSCKSTNILSDAQRRYSCLFIGLKTCKLCTLPAGIPLPACVSCTFGLGH
jgi:hypothetical protein